MGAEGAHWIGLAPFVGDRHLFQNLGDGTLQPLGQPGHPGVRRRRRPHHVQAALQLGGGHDRRPGRHRADGRPGADPVAGGRGRRGRSRCAPTTSIATARTRGFAPGVDRPAPRRRRGRAGGAAAPRPACRCSSTTSAARPRPGACASGASSTIRPARVVINQAVCEGCGDCSRVSNCLSVLPVDTEFGERREIHQSSCNKDYSCLEGDCPSFVTLRRRAPPAPAPAGARRPAARRRRGRSCPAGDLPRPAAAPLDRAGSASTPPASAAPASSPPTASLARAAAIAGYTVAGRRPDGPVAEGRRGGVAPAHRPRPGADVTTATVADGDADLYLSGDILQAASAAAPAQGRPGRGRTPWSTPTSSRPPRCCRATASVDPAAPRRPRCATRSGPSARCSSTRTGLAEAVFGNHLPANVRAARRGVPARRPAAAARRHRAGHRRARAPAADRTGRPSPGAAGWPPTPPRSTAAPRRAASGTAARRRPGGPLGPDGRQRGARRRAGRATGRCRAALRGRCSSGGPPRSSTTRAPPLARRWLDLVDRAAAVDDAEHGCALTEAVAEGWFKLLTYKDEYEVARLHLRLDLDDVAAELGFGDGYRVHVPAPPADPAPARPRPQDRHRRGRAGWRSGDSPRCAGCGARRSTSSATPATAGRSAQLADEYDQLVAAAIAGLTPDDLRRRRRPRPQRGRPSAATRTSRARRSPAGGPRPPTSAPGRRRGRRGDVTVFKVVRFARRRAGRPPVCGAAGTRVLADATGTRPRRPSPGGAVRVRLGRAAGPVPGSRRRGSPRVDVQWFPTWAARWPTRRWLAAVDPELGRRGLPPVVPGGGRGGGPPGAGPPRRPLAGRRRAPQDAVVRPAAPERWRPRSSRRAGGARPAGSAARRSPTTCAGLAYVQNHPVPLDDGHEWPFDAVNEVWFERVDDLRRRAAWFAARPGRRRAAGRGAVHVVERDVVDGGAGGARHRADRCVRGLTGRCRSRAIGVIVAARIRAESRGGTGMTTTTGSDVYYDPYDVEINADPYPVYRRLREEAPLYYNEEHDFYARQPLRRRRAGRSTTARRSSPAGAASSS